MKLTKRPITPRDMSAIRRELAAETAERQRWQREVVILRGQLTKAQQEAAEWKLRFDALLERVPLRPLEVQTP